MINTSEETLGRPVCPVLPTGLTGSGRASQRPKINELGRDPVGAREARVALRSAGYSERLQTPPRRRKKAIRVWKEIRFER